MYEEWKRITFTLWINKNELGRGRQRSIESHRPTKRMSRAIDRWCRNAQFREGELLLYTLNISIHERTSDLAMAKANQRRWQAKQVDGYALPKKQKRSCSPAASLLCAFLSSPTSLSISSTCSFSVFFLVPLVTTCLSQNSPITRRKGGWRPPARLCLNQTSWRIPTHKASRK